MNKRQYEAPKVVKVNLLVKTAILAVCHTSPSTTPRIPEAPGGTPCNVTPGCFSGPGT